MKNVRLSTLTTKVGSGATPRGGEAVYQAKGVALIRSQNVLDSAMRRDGLAYITDEAASQLNGVKVEVGDVLLNITGESVARCALVDPSYLPARVNQHVMIIRASEELEPRYLQSYLVSPSIKADLLGMSSGGTRRALTKQQVEALEIPLPPREEQQAIAEVLGALDDKIAANGVLRRTAAQLATAHYRGALTSELQSIAVADACTMLARGASPRYTEDCAATLVLNQKCIRDGRVDLGPARRTEPDRVRARTLLQAYDVLVNSTGMGTLGRVAIWDRADVATVDSHVTIARPDSEIVDPAVFGVALMEMQSDIEGLAEGSTGQTELSRHQLGALVVQLPARAQQNSLGSLIRSLSERSLVVTEESSQLAALRDALLPELMSGRLRVQDAEKTVEEVV